MVSAHDRAYASKFQRAAATGHTHYHRRILFTQLKWAAQTERESRHRANLMHGHGAIPSMVRPKPLDVGQVVKTAYSYLIKPSQVFRCLPAEAVPAKRLRPISEPLLVLLLVLVPDCKFTPSDSCPIARPVSSCRVPGSPSRGYRSLQLLKTTGMCVGSISSRTRWTSQEIFRCAVIASSQRRGSLPSMFLRFTGLITSRK